MTKEIEFYGPGDLGNHWDVDRLSKLLDKPGSELTLDNILEIAEAIKMMKHFKPELKETVEYKTRLRLCTTKVYKNFPFVNSENIIGYFKQIRNPKYRFNFFRMIEKKKQYPNLSADNFDELTELKAFSIFYILSCKGIMDRWEEKLYAFLIKTPGYIPVFFAKYTDPTRFKKEWYLPSKIDNPHSWNELVKVYVNYANANPNFLQEIAQAPSFASFKLDDFLKYSAQKRMKEDTNRVLKNGQGIKRTIEIIISDNEKWISYKKNGDTCVIIISKKWIENNLDYPTLLNNFIYLFGITDIESRSNLVSLRSQEDPIEQLYRNWTSTSFRDNGEFNVKFNLQKLYVQAYYNFLLNHDIRLEKIYEYFFNEYIPKEFKIKGFKFNAPSSDSKYLEKCRNLFSELDNIVKQYNLFSLYGNINQDFLNFNSAPVDIGNVKSIIPNKYVYASKKEGSICTQLLFSDQCFVALTLKYKEKNLEEVILHHRIQYSEIDEIDKTNLDYLIDHNIVWKKDNNLELNKNYVEILKDIYLHGEVEPYWYTSKSIDPILKKMKEKNLIRYGSTLLSEPELDFYYYICNSKKYTNGLDLRNKYIHSNSTLSEKENESNFYIILLVLILIIIRINDELCWRDEQLS